MKSPVELQFVQCPLGCPENDELVVSGRDRIHELPGEFSVVRCIDCGLMRTNPRPTPETMGFYYPEDYGPYTSTRVTEALLPDKRQPLLKRLVRFIVDFRTEALPDSPIGSMLEVGCASGAFLHKMACKGWMVEGIEYSPAAAAAARAHGYLVHIGSLETTPELSGSFDLIVAWMVLEHLHDPVGGLRRLYKWAKPDACLVLSVPNAGSLEFRLFDNRWYALHLPNHLYHFTPRTIEAVLRAGGWQIEKIWHQRVLSDVIASTGYLLKDLGFVNMARCLIDFPEKAGRKHLWLYPLAYCLSLFGQTGRMTIWARKRDD
jgi:2-polyprenyl-3-methyl-5-hydroxy-6-metoxy-1,4-benzoquinol methylase